MRSGKSYEVVSEVVVPAIRSGRRIVTNIDGISQEKIHEYLAAKHPDDDETKYGLIVHVDSAKVFEPDFFPYYDDQKGAHTDTTVQPGDLVCIDEAWRFWGATDCKIHKHHRSFFLEHGHFIHPETKIACDLVLMIQDMSTLNRFVKNVVAFNFRTHKKVALGMDKVYSLNMWEGHKQSKATKIGGWVRSYNEEIFPLYSSFKGGGSGVLVNADKRQNVMASKKLWFMLALFIVGGYVCITNVIKFFNPGELGRDGKPIPKNGVVAAGKAPQAASATGAPLPAPGRPATPQKVFSESWRVVGTFQSKGMGWVVVQNQAGVVRLESPSQFFGSGLATVGEIDGSKVTIWSGTAVSRAGEK
nr:zonular occludens toxin domain-containing protein [Massilia antarctica]